ncbi:hypothetical protein [Clostridium sp. LIBA-8841]|uniref:nSTAND3 domain-containing NTPase n=1 Tax=Clostridium sp. LIBA-8841 TaxID=2987530 RepID=UPI002AC71BF1|nr:hypothetical protein [Clostridium sp. LIBA-8841]MDZ5253770.1 hypothetical protein [Clostridium sp. LIBA-8841]
MSKINAIEQAIMGLGGGDYQKLMDSYLYKKYKYENITTLGSQTGTNKPTKGIPDSYVKLENGKYIFIMYGTVESTSYEKLKKDILSCVDKNKVNIEIDKIEEIICCHTSTNIHVEQKETLENLIPEVKITLIDISTVSHDLLERFPIIAKDHLSIEIDSGQFFEIDDFIEKYDKSDINASIGMDLIGRVEELNDLVSKIQNNNIMLVIGKSGIGKTRLVIEACRKYSEITNTKVYCIKNNSNMLYEDLKYYISGSGEYLIFVDDANQTTELQHIIDKVIDPPVNCKVKVIMTVREYAIDRVREITSKKARLEEFKIDILSDEVIKEILKKNLGIKNEKYLEQIIKIAKGNARLAILSGKIAKEKDIYSIYDSVDIFENYYGDIIKKEFGEKNKIISAFIIASFGPIKYKENTVATKLLEECDISESEFNLICEELHDKELIDIYMDKATKINDQNIRDYLFYYVLIEKKYITLEKIIEYAFFRYKRKIVYMINTILQLFNGDGVLEYFKDEVTKAWNRVNDDRENLEYAKTFYWFNEEKTLMYIQEKIDNMENEDFSLKDFNFEDKNNNKIDSEIIELLGAFKHCENFEDALYLSLELFNKKPKNVMDFYFLFSDRLCYDKQSFSLNYEKELEIIKCLWEASGEGENINLTLLLLNIIPTYLKFDFTRLEGVNQRTFNQISMNLIACDGLEKLRGEIWIILGTLYLNQDYQKNINEILLKYKPYSNFEDEIENIFKLDFKYIKDFIFSKFINLTFKQAKILKCFEKQIIRFNLKENKDLFNYNECREFVIYNTLTGNNYEDYETMIKNRSNEIYNLVKNYNEDGFIEFFRNLSNLSIKNSHESFKLGEGIKILFQKIEDKKELSIFAIKAYFKFKVKNLYCIDNIIAIAFKYMKLEEIEALINSYNYENKGSLFYKYLINIPERLIEERHCNSIKSVCLEFIRKENFFMPNIRELKVFLKIDSNLITDISRILLDNKVNRIDVAYFLKSYFDLNDQEEIVEMFNGNLDLLEKLYIYGFGNEFDYEGNLFIFLINNGSKNFLEELIINILESDCVNYYGEIFKRLWSEKSYNELVTIAFKIIVESEKEHYYCGVEHTWLGNLFIDDDNEERKIDWIKNYINNFYEDKEKIRLIFKIIVEIFSNNCIEFILYFLERNKDIEDFKNIELFSSSYSWSGSEVPLIEKKIDFLKELKGSLKVGVIKHKHYLKKLIDEKEEYKKDILLREYIEYSDF